MHSAVSKDVLIFYIFTFSTFSIDIDFFIYFRLSIQYYEFAAGCASADTHHKVTTIG